MCAEAVSDRDAARKALQQWIMDNPGYNVLDSCLKEF